MEEIMTGATLKITSMCLKLSSLFFYNTYGLKAEATFVVNTYVLKAQFIIASMALHLKVSNF